MKHTVLAVFTVLMFTLSAKAQSFRELTFMTVMPVDKEPVIDGRLDDACWSKGIAHTKYFEHSKPNPKVITNLQSSCTIMYGQKGLYVGLVNWDNEPDKLVHNVTKDWDDSMWYDDGAELYFDPDAAGVGYYKLIVNCIGKHDSDWRMDPANYHYDYRMDGVETKAQILKDRFEIECFIPWGALKDVAVPKPGTMWTFLHCRYNLRRWILAASAPEGSGTVPQCFGYLYFAGAKPPSGDDVLGIIEKRMKSNWGIDIAGAAYLHDDDGTRKIDCTFAELAERIKADELFEKANSETNLVKVAKTDEPVEPLKLKLAGKYDFSKPKGYDGYNGWYRHNPSKENYLTSHLDWGVTDSVRRPMKVLFICGDVCRDQIELETRFPLETMYFTLNFGASGTWENAVAGGTPLDKERQFQSFLARDPDLFVVTGRFINEMPPKYLAEMLRRVRDDGKSFLLLENSWRWTYTKLNAWRDMPETEVFGRKPIGFTKLGKGYVFSGDFIPNEKVTPDWHARYETRMAEYMRLLNRASTANKTIVLAQPACAATAGCVPVYGRGTNFTEAVTAYVADSTLFGSDVARWRVRDAKNNIVKDGSIKLCEGYTGIVAPIADLPGGTYFFDVVATRGGKLADVLSYEFKRDGTVGAFKVEPMKSAVPEVTNCFWVRFKWGRKAPADAKAVIELRDSPYGQLRYLDSVPASNFSVQFNIAKCMPFPTLCAEVTGKIIDADGNLLASDSTYLHFKDTGIEDYTLISWGALSEAKGLAPLYAPQLIEEYGYKCNLGESGSLSSVFNAKSVPNVAAVSCSPAKNGGFKFRTLVGFVTPWSGPLAKRVQELPGDEVHPWDPEVQAIVADAMKKVTNTAPYSVHVWNLGDENSFNTDAGHGEKDKIYYPKFLQERYGSIANFNRIHNTNAVDFATAAHKTTQQAQADKDWPSWLDHVQYIERLYSDCHQLLRKEIKKYDPKGRVGCEGSRGGDLEAMIKDLEFWGPYNSLIHDELVRVIAPEKVRGIWWGGYFNSLRDGYPVQVWEWVLSGRLNCDMFFAMQPGGSQGSFGCDFAFAPYVAQMLPYLKDLRRGEAQLMLNVPFRKDGFAIWYSHASEHAAKLDDAFTAPGAAQNALIKYCYRTGLAIDFVTKRTLKRLDDQKIVFLCGATALSDAEVIALKAFAKRGGIIAADCEPGIMDDFLAMRQEPPLKELWIPFKWNSTDEEIAAILAKKNIVNRESIAGLGPSDVIFRVREAGDMRVVGFKVPAKQCGRKVSLDLGGEGYVYQVGKGFVGKTRSIEIEKLDVPFKLYGVFDKEQAAPVINLQPSTSSLQPGTFVTLDLSVLRKGSVYRLEVIGPDGKAISNREKVFAVKDQELKFQFPFSDKPGIYQISLLDLATGLSSRTPVSVAE